MKKIVMRINVKGDSCRSKALMFASSMKGVESVGIRGKDRNHLVVTGNGVDPVDLARALRKKMGYAEIIGVGRTNAEEPTGEEPEPTYEPSASQPSHQDDHQSMQQHATGVVESSQITHANGFLPGPCYPHCVAYSSSCNHPAQYSEVCYRSGHGNDCCIM